MTEVIVNICSVEGELLERQRFYSNDQTDTHYKLAADIIDKLEHSFEFDGDSDD